MNEMDQMGNYIRDEQELAALPGLTKLQVRYRGLTEGRFTARAQDIPDLIAMLTATDRYVRDISVQD